MLDAGRDLPHGPHRLPREVVDESQRSRLLAATAEEMTKRGYASLTVGQVIALAGVSRSTFYANFDDKQDCVRVAHREAFDGLSSCLLRACMDQPDWPRKVASAVRAAIDFAVESPAQACLLLHDSVGADPVLAAHVLASNERLIGLLRTGRDQWPQAASLPPLIERALIGAATSIIGNRLMQGQADRLEEVTPELVQLMLNPYVGIDEARLLAASAT